MTCYSLHAVVSVGHQTVEESRLIGSDSLFVITNSRSHRDFFHSSTGSSYTLPCSSYIHLQDMQWCL